MNRKREIEKRFTEYLDRILAGEEITVEPDADAELRAALEFARTIRGLRTSPSESFQAQLKARLLQKLDEQEAIALERRESFWGNIWRQPIWQGAVMVAFAVIVVGLLWRAGIIAPELPEATTTPTATATPTTVPTTTVPTTTSMPTTAPTTTPTTIPTQIPQDVYLRLDANTNKLIYESGEEVIIELILTNDGQNYLTMEKLPPIVSLMDAGTKQPVYTFTSGQQIMTIAPNQTISFILTWNQEDFEGELVSGRFYIEIEDLIYLDQPIQLHLDDPVQFDIIPEL